MKKHIVIPAAITLMVWGAILACSEKDDTKALRDLIHKGKTLAEANDIAGILDLATEDVRAMPMDLDRRGIRAVLWRTFRYYGPLKILYPRPKIKVNDAGDHASARFPLLIVKKEQTFPGLDPLREDPLAWLDAIGEHADLYHLSLTLTKSSGKWRVRQSTLQRFTGLGFDAD